ncbi:MAG TPA: Asp-tRNA(Asn)/Glu-tRNA(Gln) amidotransferase subunit GatC [Cyclobacteriaceae bacterium]|nr:Asp-tRNA(Asn)/Glu-tRNA(Gln) amidotransferase subunit GatC [Cyclobacteriaceae bacterium]
MKITRELLDKIAHLARLELSEQDAAKMMQDMTAIIDWMEKLNEVNTDSVEPLTSMSHEVNMLREDEVKNQLDHKAVLQNAPQKDLDYFHVPKVLD